MRFRPFALVLVVALLAASGVSFASETHCSNAPGDLQFAASSYEGGAPPHPGMVMERDTWTDQGKVIGTSVDLYGPVPGPISMLQAQWDESSRRVVDDSQAQALPRGTSIYAEKVTLTRLDGKPIDGTDEGPTRLETYLICEHTYSNVPLP